MRQLHRRLVSSGSLLALVWSLTGLLALLIAAPAQAQTNLYASPSGSSTSNCSVSTPCSLTRAQAYVETLTSAMSSDIIVNLAAGTYTLSSTWTFNSANGDSGTGGHNVIWQASGYGTSSQAGVTISGGQAVTGWTLWDSTNNIWKAPAPVNPLTTRQLYVNGVRAVRATGSLPVTLTENGTTGYTASSSAMASWHNPSAIEFVYKGSFNERRCDVSSISGTSITMDSPCYPNLGATAPSYAENAYELLSAPGQWYLDTSGSVDGSLVSTIYYIPRSGESMSTATVIAPVLQTLVSGQGTLTSLLLNIQFKGLTFAYATWLGPNSGDGFVEDQANFHETGANANSDPLVYCCFLDTTGIPGNVDFSAASNIRLEGNLFIHLGGVGLSFEYGSNNNTVIGNELTDISGNGIQIGNTGDYQTSDSRTILSSNTIQDNYIHDMPAEYHAGVGIWQGYSQNDVITHNQLDDLPYSGISTGWTFGQYTDVTQGNQYTDNLIYSYMESFTDGGAIYTNGQQGTSTANGSVISGNVVHDQVGTYNAFYDDEGSEYVTLQNNVTYNLGSNVNSWGGCTPTTDPYPGEDMSFENSFGPDLTSTFGGSWACGTPTGLTLSGNTQISNLAACNGITACQDIVNTAGLESTWQCLLTRSCTGPGSGGGTTTTRDFTSRPTAPTALTGTYEGIDWGSSDWETQYLTGWGYFAGVNNSSTSEVTYTFTLPAGTVLTNINVGSGDAGSYVKVSQPGNSQVQCNLPANEYYISCNTSWTSATGATVTIIFYDPNGAWDIAIDTLAYTTYSSGPTTVDFTSRPTGVTSLTGVYEDIDWGSSDWVTQYYTGGWGYYLWADNGSTTEISYTITLPAGKVLTNITAACVDAGSYIKVSQPGNSQVQFNLQSSPYGSYNTGWTSATGATVTITLYDSVGAWDINISTFTYQ